MLPAEDPGIGALKECLKEKPAVTSHECFCQTNKTPPQNALNPVYGDSSRHLPTNHPQEKSFSSFHPRRTKHPRKYPTLSLREKLNHLTNQKTSGIFRLSAFDASPIPIRLPICLQSDSKKSRTRCPFWLPLNTDAMPRASHRTSWPSEDTIHKCGSNPNQFVRSDLLLRVSTTYSRTNAVT